MVEFCKDLSAWTIDKALYQGTKVLGCEVGWELGMALPICVGVINKTTYIQNCKNNIKKLHNMEI